MQRKLLVTILTAGILGMSFYAFGDTTPEDAADYRIATMTALRGHVFAASLISRGLVEDQGYLVNHAQGMVNGVAELHRVFPDGSLVGESEALPVIWEKPEEFAAAIEKAIEATAAFAEVAGSGDMEVIDAAFRNVGLACRGCHDNFRVEHE